MKREARMTTLAGLRVDIDLPSSDIRAILQLIGSAQLSIANHGDAFCAGLLDQCAAQLRERFGLGDTARSNDPAWADSSLPAVVHLLIYVQAEVTDRLGDPAWAAVLDQCIDRLLQIHVPQPHDCGQAVTAH
jgi:hypothetical protein